MPRRKIKFSESLYASGFVARLNKLQMAAGGVGSLAKKCNVTPGNLYHYLTQGGEPSYAILASLASGTGKSLDWLMLGKEAAPLASTPITNEAVPPPAEDGFWRNFRQMPEFVYEKDKPWIPRVQEKPSVIAFSREWLQREFKDDFGLLKYMIAFDRDMEPMIRLGEIMLLIPMPLNLEEYGRRDGIYVILWDGILAVRKIQFQGNLKITIGTADPEYKTWTARYYRPDMPDITEDGAVAFIARVVWSGHLQ